MSNEIFADDKKVILTSESIHEIKRLKPKIRNKVRAITAVDAETAVKILNKQRKQSSVYEIFLIEKAIRSLRRKKPLLPDYFPKLPQVDENYERLCFLNLDKQLELLDLIVGKTEEILTECLQCIERLNIAIVGNNFEVADSLLGSITESFGFSHLILRKAALIKTKIEKKENLSNLDRIIEISGVIENKIISSSIHHCFQEDQDFLSLKKAVLGLTDKGNANKFSRDIARLTFQPIAKDEDDLSELIQSGIQSSLIDAVIIAKINTHIFDPKKYKHLSEIFHQSELNSISLNDIAFPYVKLEDPEIIFYKHSSAWLEFDEVIKYRMLQDHFYDASDAPYLKIDSKLVSRVSPWSGHLTMEDLAKNARLTTHQHSNLREIESKGTVTRSSLFNLMMHITDGCIEIEEDDLIRLMGETSALSRTIDLNRAKNFAQISKTNLSQIIIYLLIAKRSKNELDSHRLRRLMQEIILEEHDGRLSNFVSSISKRSKHVAYYIYDVCNEDFIARLSHIIKTSNEITETRASLHRLMGEITGEKSYFDRARNILIDHRINLVRDEIDDNRIYVDAGRFFEWINDEVMHEINALLRMLEHQNAPTNVDNVQLIALIESCYKVFCSNKYFGIASYLGRRIRHGTFKGHLYSSVISIEANYSQLLEDAFFSPRWTKWKENYEEKIDRIIKEKLHVESPKKKDGFLQPNIKSSGKVDIALACSKDLLKDYSESGHTLGTPQILIEYCWRLAEIDLKAINTFLKNQKNDLVAFDLLNELKNCVDVENQQLVKDFARDLQGTINNRISAVYGWFKRPQSVAPKASLGLLYKAVVAEVKQSFSDFNPETDFDEDNDVELMGGAYLVIYDALYVIVYNAAKHGMRGGEVVMEFSIITIETSLAIEISITSEIKMEDDEENINQRLAVSPDDDIENAQLYEDRSGIKKLYHLKASDANFDVRTLSCQNRKVTVSFSYSLVH